MAATLQTILLLLAVLVVVAVVARRLDIAPSILLVVAGIALALIPGLPRIELAPELVLLGILPPLIYSAGVAMSWREFKFNLRPIALFAFGLVVFTAAAVAVAGHYLLGMPLAVGFVLGAIVSPTDAVAPLAVVRRLGLPRRLIVVLEGEGLANDATALILYRFAVAAVGTGAVLVRHRRRRIRPHRHRRNRLRHRRRLGELAAAPLGGRSARRDHAVVDDALPRLSGAAAPGRLGRVGGGRRRPLCELERAAAHSGGDAAAGHLLLGPADLSARRLVVPGHRHAVAHADRPVRFDVAAPAGAGGAAHRRRRRRCAPDLGLSGGLSAALAQSVAGAPRSAADLAISVHARLHRRARRRLAGGGAGAAADHERRRAVSRTATSSCSSPSASSSSR